VGVLGRPRGDQDRDLSARFMRANVLIRDLGAMFERTNQVLIRPAEL